MKLSLLCHTATGETVALGAAGQDALHRRCPGQCVDNGGKVIPCECECHQQESMIMREALDRLPRAVEVLTAGGQPAPQDRTVPRTPPNGRCEHCGASCGIKSRFAPGHDAKLRSSLWDGARRGSYKDWAEIVLRGWIPRDFQRPGGISFETEARGEAFAKEQGYALVERRNRVRQEAAA